MKAFYTLFLGILFISCSEKQATFEKVISFKGQQVTGVTVSNDGAVFANFPRWREGVENSVVKIEASSSTPFPNEAWNSWQIGQEIKDSIFVAVQSVVAFEDHLYVLDTRNPLFRGVVDRPKVFDFNVNTGELNRIYHLPPESYFENSYINDLRVDKKNNTLYFTDSGHAGLLVLNRETGAVKRALTNHASTLAEVDALNCSNGLWENTVHSDGIALDVKNDKLYYHALTGYNLFAIDTDVLINDSEEDIQAKVELVGKTTAPDGMIFDDDGNLYLADLEGDKIMKLNPASKELSTFAEGDHIHWADTFSIYDNKLYYTNSRIHQAGIDISNMEFEIYAIPFKK